jgi:hypothetical protein
MFKSNTYNSYSVGTTPVALDLSGCKKLIIKADGAEILIARDSTDFAANRFFPLSDGVSLIFDADLASGLVPIDDLVYFATAAGTATLYVWRMG